MKTVLFVCTQNVFRSFSAQKLFEKYLRDCEDLDSFKIISAGTRAHPDRPYSYTLNKLSKLGVKDISHNQTKISKDIVENTDYIICMTNEHKKFIKNNFGKNSVLINEIVYGKSTDLEDDDESSIYSNSSKSLKDFVEQTIDKINYAIPFIYDYCNKN